tara:strand:+ start:381 stop:578 length:198 start_codon:yes stop_codon:yes gene_type:complete
MLKTYKGDNMKEEFKANEKNYNLSTLNPMIKISHFEKDKHVKTDVYPISHFLDHSSKEIKNIKYS